MSRGTDLAMYLNTPVLAGLDGAQRLELGLVENLDGLSSGEWAFLTCCIALHDIEANAGLFDTAHRTLLVAALDALTLKIENTLVPA